MTQKVRTFYLIKRLTLWENIELQNIYLPLVVDRQFGIGFCRVFDSLEEAEQYGGEIMVFREVKEETETC